MLEVIQQHLLKVMSDEEKLNKLREFLQILTLKILYDKGLHSNLAFVGGTALRVLYGLRRFSEDLDFSLIEKNGYNFSRLISTLKDEYGRYGLEMETNTQENKTVNSAMLKFDQLLYKVALSPLKGQKLSIKFEIDTNPAPGWKLSTTIISKIYTFTVVHYDKPSLFSGKLHACFLRKFTKGRDIYDFIWYLGAKAVPNFTLLNNAIRQTQHKDYGITRDNFKDFLLEYIGKIDFSQAKKDVERFLEDKNELALFNAEAIKSSIEKAY